MTEEEWLTGSNPTPMLNYLGSAASKRKMRLLACLCCRRIWSTVPVEVPVVIENQLSLAERHADKGVRKSRLPARRPGYSYSALSAVDMAAHRHNDLTVLRDAVRVARSAILREASMLKFDHLDRWEREIESNSIQIYSFEAEIASIEEAAQVLLIREIFGNPFRPVDTACITPTAKAIATAIYQDRAFDRLPILADALEEADCTNADVLLHCRQPGEHVRGCWVVDLVLGKE